MKSKKNLSLILMLVLLQTLVINANNSNTTTIVNTTSNSTDTGGEIYKDILTVVGIYIGFTSSTLYCLLVCPYVTPIIYITIMKRHKKTYNQVPNPNKV